MSENNNQSLDKIQQITTKKLTWINVVSPQENDLPYFEKKFNIHPIDLKDCLPTLQRPKLVERPGYIFMILLFPVYDRKTREVVPSEIDFFINRDYVITVNNGKLLPLAELFRKCQKDPEFKEKFLSEDASVLLYEILNRLFDYCFPMLNHVNIDIDAIEKQIFAGYEKRMVREILIIKQNIVNFRKAMQFHESVLKKLIDKAPRIFPAGKLSIYFADLLSQSKDIWDTLENYQETINALHETNTSLISFRLNDIMRLLTVISVIMLPVTLVANIFGMNVDFMPFTRHPLGFWLILALMGVISYLMIWYFKKKDWL